MNSGERVIMDHVMIHKYTFTAVYTHKHLFSARVTFVRKGFKVMVWRNAGDIISPVVYSFGVLLG